MLYVSGIISFNFLIARICSGRLNYKMKYKPTDIFSKSFKYLPMLFSLT